MNALKKRKDIVGRLGKIRDNYKALREKYNNLREYLLANYDFCECAASGCDRLIDENNADTYSEFNDVKFCCYECGANEPRFYDIQPENYGR